jgi:hypothetical protein
MIVADKSNIHMQVAAVRQKPLLPNLQQQQQPDGSLKTNAPMPHPTLRRTLHWLTILLMLYVVLAPK